MIYHFQFFKIIFTQSGPLAVTQHKLKTAPEGAEFEYLLDNYFFLRLATPVKLIRPESNNQTVVQTVTTLALARIIDASSVHYELCRRNHCRHRTLPGHLQRYHQSHRTLIFPYPGDNQDCQE